mmetsp:Transcript_10958/g.13760  ORF Transcript_10958/g.13760 Transcript_10958/m.13760 type:complete len:103 (-) Transcript_10958:316-624(-)
MYFQAMGAIFDATMCLKRFALLKTPNTSNGVRMEKVGSAEIIKDRSMAARSCMINDIDLFKLPFSYRAAVSFSNFSSSSNVIGSGGKMKLKKNKRIGIETIN